MNDVTLCYCVIYVHSTGVFVHVAVYRLLRWMFDQGDTYVCAFLESSVRNTCSTLLYLYLSSAVDPAYMGKCQRKKVITIIIINS